MKIGEFFISLFVDAAQGELTINKLVSSMGELEVASVGEIAILGKLASSLEEITAHSLKSALGIKDLETSTGLSTESLQEWLNVAGYVNIQSSTMASTLAEMAHALGRGELTGDYGGLKSLGMILQRAGRSLDEFRSKDPKAVFKLLDTIRHSKFFQDLTPPQQKAALGDYSAIQAALQQMRMTDDQFKKWAHEGPVLSEDEVKKWNSIHIDLTSVEQISLRIKATIAEWFSEDMQAGLRATIYLLGKTADAIDDKRPHSDLNKFVRRTVGDTLYPPNLIRDLFHAGKAAGVTSAEMLDYTGGLIRTAYPVGESVMAGRLGQQKTINSNTSVSVVIPGSNLTPQLFKDQYKHVIKEVHQEVIQEAAAQVNPPGNIQ